MSKTEFCNTCGGDLAAVGVMWDMGYRVAAEHGCDGDPDVCATLCPVDTPDVEMIPVPCPQPHQRAWTNEPD